MLAKVMLNLKTLMKFDRILYKFGVVFVLVLAITTVFIIWHKHKTKENNQRFVNIKNRIESLSNQKVGSLPVQFLEKNNSIDVLFGDNKVASYYWSNDSPKTILYDVQTFSGTMITRDVPFEKIERRSKDHPHHTGIFFTYANVNGENFWSNTNVPPQIKQTEIETEIDKNGKGHIFVTLQWETKEGRDLLEEKRDMSFFVVEDGYVIDFSINLTAKDEKVVFKDTKEGMFAIRLADWIREKDGAGRYFSSEGKQKEKHVWGTRSEWVCLEGMKNDKNIGVAIINQPDSVNYPTFWHTRGYGLFAANPFGQYDFETFRKKQDAKQLCFSLEPNESVHFGFKIYIYEATTVRP